MTAKYDIFEASFAGPAGGNPYLEVSFDAVFAQHSREVRVPGFYDGAGMYRIRLQLFDQRIVAAHRYEADILAVRLVGNGNTKIARQLPCLRLG